MESRHGCLFQPRGETNYILASKVNLHASSSATGPSTMIRSSLYIIDRFCVAVPRRNQENIYKSSSASKRNRDFLVILYPLSQLPTMTSEADSKPVETWNGSCHCGNVRFTLNLPGSLYDQDTTSCNCMSSTFSCLVSSLRFPYPELS
jgi:hypothetical protein